MTRQIKCQSRTTLCRGHLLRNDHAGPAPARRIRGETELRPSRLILLLYVVSAQLLYLRQPRLREYDRRKFCQPEPDTVLILVYVTTAFDERAKDLFQREIRILVSTLSPANVLKSNRLRTRRVSELLYDGCVPDCATGVLDFFVSECTEGLVEVETRRQLSDIGDAPSAGSRTRVTWTTPHSEDDRQFSSTGRCQTSPGSFCFF